MQLDQLQKAFIEGVYAGDLEAADQVIQGSSGLSAAEHFAIYQGSVTATLVAALGDIFPRVKTALGTAFFDALARKYIKSHPSRSASLDKYGEEFAAFCTRFTPLKEYPYVADLARVDWAWHRAFHSPDLKPLDVEALKSRLGAEASDDRFLLHPSAFIVASEYPIYQLWHFNEHAREASSEDEAALFNLDQAAETILVWRREYVVQTRLLNDVEQALFLQFQEPTSMAVAFEQSAMIHAANDIDPASLSHALTVMLEQGLLCDCRAERN